MLSDFADRLRRALGPIPSDLAEAAGALAAEYAAHPSPPGTAGGKPALSPWAAWTLVALLRYLPRQLWAGKLALDGVLKRGASRSLPGFPGWTYCREGDDCEVSNAETGEQIEFQLYQGSAEYIHPFAVVDDPEPPKHLEPPEARLLVLHPVIDRIVLAFDELHADGALLRHPRKHVYRLAEQAKGCDADVRAFAARWEDPALRLWLAATLGDWPLAAELAPGEARIQRAAERCHADRVLRLESRLDDARFGSYALEALVEVAPPDRLGRYLVAALEGAPDGLTTMAAKMIADDPTSDFTSEMADLFERLSPERDVSLMTLTAGYLLGRGHAPALVFPSLMRCARVERVEGTLYGGNLHLTEIALLALEHAPGDALPLVRLALRSPSAAMRNRIATVLMLLGGAWAERALLSVLPESTDEQLTAPARIALRRCGGPEALAEVERWEAAHESPDKGRAWRNVTTGFISIETEELRERVERVRRALPPDFGER